MKRNFSNYYRTSANSAYERMNSWLKLLKSVSTLEVKRRALRQYFKNRADWLYYMEKAGTPVKGV